MKRETAQLLEAADGAMRQGQPLLARRRWEAVLQQEPAQAVALNGLGTLALQAGQFEDAAGYFLRAAEAEPKAAVLWLNHAKAARQAADDVAERSSLLRAAALEPEALVVRVRLAELAERTGDAGEAATQWRMVTALADVMGSVPPDAAYAVEHGRDFLARRTAMLSERVDEALAAGRSRTTPRDRRRVEAAIDHMFGCRPIYVNQCSGLHVPFLPADEYFDRTLFPWLEELEAGTDAIRAELVRELRAGREGFEPYVSLPPGTPDNVWTPLDNSVDWSSLHLWRHGRRDEAACARFPETAALIDGLPLAHLPDRMPTVFFSILAPHAHIPPHTGVTNARAIIHLPLIIPPGCRFRVGGETREWVQGQAFAFDDTIEHEAWNDSGEPRAILILDTWNPHLTGQERALLVDFYGANEHEVMSF